MNRNEVLVVEISGKRQGTSKQRPTETFRIDYDHIIISNNSDGYVTEWQIVNVPEEYRQWYVENYKSSDNAWYAPMNRSYAIKYAREKGYKYLIQLDDNITNIEISYYIDKNGAKYRYGVPNEQRRTTNLLNDFIEMLVLVLENTNAVMSGCNLMGIATPNYAFLKEAYCYSLFALDLQNCPPVFQGDFEDDIEYRFKCKQMNKPVVQVVPLRYGKTGQKSSNDLTGCRAEYAKQGIKRGEHMTRLYGGYYSARMTNKTASTRAKKSKENIFFKHDIKPFKVGVIVYDYEPIRQKMRQMLKEYSCVTADTVKIKKKCVE